MGTPVHKVIELVGTSAESVDDAINGAISEASKTLHGLEWFQIQEVRGMIRDGRTSQFQVVMKVGFKLDR